jgi:cytochrome P450
MLMHATDEETGATMSNEQIRDEVMTMFLAGHETTATALTWVWYVLAKHPAVEEKFYKEIKEKIGNRLPTAEDYNNLTYTKNIFKETMRLYPPVWTIAREATEDVEIKGYHFPKGSVLCWLTYIMQRKDQYFENPDQFIPERWDTDEVKDLPRFVYAPFGGGSRMCIGEGFAWMEAVMIMATIASRFRLKLPGNFTTTINPAFTLRPKDHLVMSVRKPLFLG